MGTTSAEKSDELKRRKIIDIDWDTFELTGGKINILTMKSAERLARVIRELIGDKEFTLQVWRDFTPPTEDEGSWGVPDVQIEGCYLRQDNLDFPKGVRFATDEGQACLQLAIVDYDGPLCFPTTFVDSDHLLDLGERTTQVNTYHPGRVILATWDYGHKPPSWVEYWKLCYNPQENDD